MRGMSLVPRATRGLLAAAIGLAAAGAQASTPATVDPATQVSTLNLPRVQALFDPVPHSPGYGGYFSINGLDYSFENDAVIDNVIEPGAEGLTFSSYHATSTGIVEATPTGYYTWPGHSTDITLYNINFVAKDGYQIDSLQLEITATTFVSGSGSASVDFGSLGQTTTSTNAATGIVTHHYTRVFDGSSTGAVFVSVCAIVSKASFAVPGRAATSLGAFASDPEGDALTYAWAQTSGPMVRA